MNKSVCRLRRFCAFLAGVTFFMSGIFKLADPTGTRLIVAEYFKFFHAGFLGFASGAVGLVLSLLETLAGAALIINVFRRTAALTVSIMTAFFTILTAILLIFNPDMSCGCFGKALELSHMQSFIKDLVLCVLCAAAFIPFRDFGSPAKVKYVAFALVAAGVAGGTIYCAVTLPPVDYTAFAPGAELYVEDGPSDRPAFGEREAFIYEKGGRRGTFTLDRLPDSTWTFVGMDTLRRDLPFKEKELAVLTFMDAEGEYCDRLATEGNVLAVSVYDPDGLSGHAWKEMPDLNRRLAAAGFRPVFIFAADTSLEVPEGIEPYFSDYKTLVTLNRSNGGATLISDGTVVRKWARNFIPDEDGLASIAKTNPADLAVSTATKGRIRFQAFLLYVFAVMLFL